MSSATATTSSSSAAARPAAVLAARLSRKPGGAGAAAGSRRPRPQSALPPAGGLREDDQGHRHRGAGRTVPQRHMRDRVFRYTQAKVIGGGSTINAQVYTRGNALDYDEWRQAGCTGWSYDDVLPYFRKAEDNDTFDNRFHGKGGPLGVSRPRAPLPICEAYFAAAAAARHPAQPRHRPARRQDGAGYYQLTQRNARRSSTAMAYLAPNRRPAEPDGAHRRAGAADRRRGRPGARGRADRRQPAEAASEVILCLRRHRLAAAVAALRHRPGRPPDRPWHRRSCWTSRRSARTCRTTWISICICEVSGPHTYDRFAKPHWSALAGAAIPADPHAARSPRQPLRDRRLLVCRSGRPLARPAAAPRPRHRASRPASRRCRRAG